MRNNSPLSLIVAVIPAALFAWAMMRALDYGNADLVPLVIAGRLVANGQADHLYARDTVHYNVVNDDAFAATATDLGSAFAPTPFVYPPIVAWILAPTASMSFEAIARNWFLVSLFVFGLVIWLTLTMYLPEWNRPVTWGAILLFACIFEPLRYSFSLGQNTLAILTATLGALYFEHRRTPWIAGVLLAMAVFIKLTPLIVVVPWLWRGAWRAVAWTCAALVGLATLSVLVAGWSLNAAYVARLREIGGSIVLAYNNVSLQPTMSRFFAPEQASQDWRIYEPYSGGVTLALAILLIAAAAAAASMFRTDRRDPHSHRRAEGFAILTILIAPNIAWTHYFVLLIPVAAIVIATRPVGSRFASICAAVALAVCCWPLMPIQNTVPTGSSAAALAIPCASALLLWAALVWNGRQSGLQSRGDALQ